MPEKWTWNQKEPEPDREREGERKGERQTQGGRERGSREQFPKFLLPSLVEGAVVWERRGRE